MSQNKTTDPIYLIAPLGNPGRRVRLAKTVELLSQSHGETVEFWGWRRLPEEPLGDTLGGISKSRALIGGGGYRSKTARLLYLWWVVRVFFTVLFKGPRKVYALGLETALPVWAASKLRPRVKYIFDDADRFVLIFSLPARVEKILIWLERKVSRSALSHIIPIKSRYDYETPKMAEVFNMPSAEQIGEAEALAANAPKRRKDTKLMVYINGWLDPTRGLTLIGGAVDELAKRGRSDIQFKVAVGNLTAEPPAFFSHDNVAYLGSLSHLQSMAEYKSSDAVLTFYDPSIRINRFAIPNKWGDAIAMETPVIVNEGVVTAAPLLEAGAAFATPFDDPLALTDLLVRLADNPGLTAAARKAAASLQSRYTYFDVAMGPIIEKLTAT